VRRSTPAVRSCNAGWETWTVGNRFSRRVQRRDDEQTAADALNLTVATDRSHGTDLGCFSLGLAQLAEADRDDLALVLDILLAGPPALWLVTIGW